MTNTPAVHEGGLTMNPVPHTRQDSGREEDDRMMRLVETSAHTTMGKLLRKFWHPMALSKTVVAGTARPVRLLGEDLALYRGQSDTAYLIADRCCRQALKSSGNRQVTHSVSFR
jgi:hypothetical protein